MIFVGIFSSSPTVRKKFHLRVFFPFLALPHLVGIFVGLMWVRWKNIWWKIASFSELCAMPKSHESSSEFEFSNENQQPNTTPHNRNVPLGVNSKKFRHQNFSKNIYIGTRNAERWDTFRSTLAFKNDVEFVSYLLKLAENDLANGNGWVFFA